MPLLPRLTSLRRNLFHKARNEEELTAELDAYLEMLVEQKINAGLDPVEARRAALIELGGKEQVKEQVREVSMGHQMETFWRDLRYALRMLWRSPGFAAVAVLSLALGIGANTAIFSLINALMLRMLPVKNAEELALFSVIGPNMPSVAGYNFNYPLYEMFRDHNQSFTGVITGAYVGRARLLVNEQGAVAESVEQQRVSGNFFSVLGVNPVVGRALTEADDNQANGQTGAVISFEYWRRRFGSDPQVVGRQVTVNNTALTIVGVAPPGFFGFVVGSKPELWWPIKAVNDPNLRREGAHWIRVIGRLRPGVSRAQAQAEMEAVLQQQINNVAAASLAIWTPTQRRNHFERHISLESGGTGYTTLRRQFRQTLFLLLAAVGLTLLIACVNVANLLLARAATRRKEIAVRLSLGAGRLRLLRQLLTESVLLAMIGGAAGLLFARACLRGLITYLPQQTQAALDVPLDARVLAFTLVVSVLTGLLFGLAPAWQATRLNLSASLKDQNGASASRSRLALNKTLVVTQVALSLFLLIGAGLFMRSLRNLRTLDAGFDYENIVQFSIDPGGGYNAERRSDLYKQMLARLETLPGAQSATLWSGGGVSFNVSVPGYTPVPDENLSCDDMVVGPRFFKTMKMPILAGRDFGLQDERPPAPPNSQSAAGEPQSMAGAPPLYAIINQAMARYFFGNENPIGRRFTTRGDWPIEIIGVTKDARHGNLREQPSRTYYLYYYQQPERGGMTLQLRASGGTAGGAGTIGRLARELSPQAQVVGLQMMSDEVNESLTQERFIAQLGSAFSLFALLLTCVGIYGVMSYAMTRRTNEIGIRVALGATVRHVLWMVMREVSLLVALGVGIGLAAALATTHLISTLLFGLASNDPLTLTLATLLMIGFAALAGYLPARRAARVDPVVALRHD